MSKTNGQSRPVPPTPPGTHAATPNAFNLAFRRFANWSANAVGSKWAFTLAVLVIIAWGATGPIFHYSDTWQLVINTGTTIVTFIMVFLIQNTQNRDAKAIHLKLDELLRGVKGARTALVNLEELSDEELAELQKQFERTRERAARKAEHAADHAQHKASEAYVRAEEVLDTTEEAEERATRAHEAAAAAREKAESAEEVALRTKKTVADTPH
jgi:low affinity Fe/Cu permease